MALANLLGMVGKDGATDSTQDPTPRPLTTSMLRISSHRECPLILDLEQKAAQEYFAILRSRVINSCKKSGIRSLLITSPQQEDGKSFISLNLAITIAQLRHGDVLLIDGDLRLSRISELLDSREGLGLASFLQGAHQLEECIHPTGVPHLFVLPA